MPWALLTNRYVLAAIAFALTLAYAGFEHWRANHWRDKHFTFVAQTEALGKAQEAATKARILSDKLAKDTADAEHKAVSDRLAADLARLRHERSGRSYLSAPAPGAASPERATFYRDKLERTIREFTETTAGIIERCDGQRIDLDTSKKWAQNERTTQK